MYQVYQNHLVLSKKDIYAHFIHGSYIIVIKALEIYAIVYHLNFLRLKLVVRVHQWLKTTDIMLVYNLFEIHGFSKCAIR